MQEGQAGRGRGGGADPDQGVGQVAVTAGSPLDAGGHRLGGAGHEGDPKDPNGGHGSGDRAVVVVEVGQ